LLFLLYFWFFFSSLSADRSVRQIEPITALGATAGSSGYGKVPPPSQPKPVIMSEPVWNVAVKGHIAPTSDLPPPPKNSLTEKVGVFYIKKPKLFMFCS
jgi:hypothetical protein